MEKFQDIRIKQSSDVWITSEILERIRLRDKYLTKFKKSKSQLDYDQYLMYRNQVRYKKDKAKANHYVNAVNDNQNQPKKLWNVLNELGSSSKCKSKSSNIGLCINNLLCFDIKIDTF